MIKHRITKTFDFQPPVNLKSAESLYALLVQKTPFSNTLISIRLMLTNNDTKTNVVNCRNRKSSTHHPDTFKSK